MAKTQTRTALVSSTNKTAATVTRGRLDCSALDGGILTLRITNGATAPTTPGTATILVAHKDTSMPAAASEGSADTDWKQVNQIGGSSVNSGSARQVYRFGPEIAYIEVEFSTHTGNDVTVEAIATGYAYP